MSTKAVAKNIKKENDNRNIRVLQFLEVYEKHASLWNPCLESYKNKNAREDAYTSIINELNLPNLTINDVKLKVKSIRTTYKKELRLQRQHQQDGKPYTPKLFWFNKANAFLKNVSMTRQKRLNSTEKSSEFNQSDLEFIKTPNPQTAAVDDVGNSTSSVFEYKTQRSAELEARISESNIGISEDEQQPENELTAKYSSQCPENDYQMQSTNNVISTTPAATTTTYILNTKCGSHSANVANATTVSGTGIGVGVNMAEPQTLEVQGATSNSDDEYDYFCRSVAAQLRSINDNYSRSVAKLKIQQILFEAETGHYRNNPCITIPVSQNINNL